MRQSGKTLNLLVDAAIAQKDGGSVVVIHKHDFARYCRNLARANGIDLSGIRFMSHDDIMNQKWRGIPANYFVDAGPSPPLGFWAEIGAMAKWNPGRPVRF